MSKIQFVHATVLQGAYAPVLRDAVVHVEEGKITYVGQTQSAQADRTIDLGGKLLMPAFYNLHSHVVMNLLRSYASDLPLQEWLDTRILPAEDKFTAEAAYWGAMSAVCEMTAAGVVGFNDQYFFLDEVAKAAQESGMRAILARGIVAFGDEDGGSRLQEAQELFDRYHNTGRIKVYMGPHAQYTVNNKTLKQIAEHAQKLGTGVHMHISETRGEHERCLQQQGMTPLALAQSCGLLEVPFIGAHCVWLSEEDVRIMAEHKQAVIASCPRSNLYLGSGIAPLTKYQAAGIAMALGTDGAASNDKLSILSEAEYAVMLQKGVACDPKAFSAQQAFDMATRGGAQAMGVDGGEIVPGKCADLIVLNTDGLRYAPEYDVLASVLYAGSDNDVCLTMIGGDIVYENGKHGFADAAEVRDKMRFYGEKLK